MIPKSRTSAPRLAVFVGTGLQARIAAAIVPDLTTVCDVEVVSLDPLYQFGIDLTWTDDVHTIGRRHGDAWYERSRLQKARLLPGFCARMTRLAQRVTHALFYVDTGILERTAIRILGGLGVRTVVLQDAMKRRPKQGPEGGLTWFGAGGADLYLVCGERYRALCPPDRTRVVGSPILPSRLTADTGGDQITFVNQCFARYGEVDLETEVAFVREVVSAARKYGPVEVRLHPHNDPAAYAGLAGSPGAQSVRVVQHDPLPETLAAARVVMGVNSTVLLEALAVGIPVFSLAWHPSPFELPVGPVVHRCDSLGAMERSLASMPDPPDSVAVAQELEAHVAASGQEAVTRITRAIDGFVKT